MRRLEFGYFIFSCTYTGFYINRSDGLVYRVPQSEFNWILQRQLSTVTFPVLQIYGEKQYNFRYIKLILKEHFFIFKARYVIDGKNLATDDRVPCRLLLKWQDFS